MHFPKPLKKLKNTNALQLVVVILSLSIFKTNIAQADFNGPFAQSVAECESAIVPELSRLSPERQELVKALLAQGGKSLVFEKHPNEYRLKVLNENEVEIRNVGHKTLKIRWSSETTKNEISSNVDYRILNLTQNYKYTQDTPSLLKQFLVSSNVHPQSSTEEINKERKNNSEKTFHPKDVQNEIAHVFEETKKAGQQDLAWVAPTATGKTFLLKKAIREQLADISEGRSSGQLIVVVLPENELSQDTAQDVESELHKDPENKYFFKSKYWGGPGKNKHNLNLSVKDLLKAVSSLDKMPTVLFTTDESFAARIANATEEEITDFRKETSLLILDEAHNMGAPNRFAALNRLRTGQTSAGMKSPYHNNWKAFTLSLTATPVNRNIDLQLDLFRGKVFWSYVDNAEEYLTRSTPSNRPSAKSISQLEKAISSGDITPFSEFILIGPQSKPENSSEAMWVQTKVGARFKVNPKLYTHFFTLLKEHLKAHTMVKIVVSDTDEAEEVSKFLNSCDFLDGARFETYHSKVETKERETRRKNWEEHKIKGLITVKKLGEGDDTPPLSFYLDLRRSTSAREILQYLGRAFRLYPGKEHLDAALFFDIDSSEVAELFSLVDSALRGRLQGQIKVRKDERKELEGNSSLNPDSSPEDIDAALASIQGKIEASMKDFWIAQNPFGPNSATIKCLNQLLVYFQKFGKYPSASHLIAKKAKKIKVELIEALDNKEFQEAHAEVFSELLKPDTSEIKKWLASLDEAETQAPKIETAAPAPEIDDNEENNDEVEPESAPKNKNIKIEVLNYLETPKAEDYSFFLGHRSLNDKNTRLFNLGIKFLRNMASLIHSGRKVPNLSNLLQPFIGINIGDDELSEAAKSMLLEGQLYFIQAFLYLNEVELRNFVRHCTRSSRAEWDIPPELVIKALKPLFWEIYQVHKFLQIRIYSKRKIHGEAINTSDINMYEFDTFYYMAQHSDEVFNYLKFLQHAKEQVPFKSHLNLNWDDVLKLPLNILDLPEYFLDNLNSKGLKSIGDAIESAYNRQIISSKRREYLFSRIGLFKNAPSQYKHSTHVYIASSYLHSIKNWSLEIFDFPLEFLELYHTVEQFINNRTYNNRNPYVETRFHSRSVNDLIKLTEYDLLRLRNFGQKSMRLTREALERWNLTVGMKQISQNPNFWATPFELNEDSDTSEASFYPYKAESKFLSFGDKLNISREEILELKLSSLELPDFVMIRSQKQNWQTVGDLLQKIEKGNTPEALTYLNARLAYFKNAPNSARKTKYIYIPNKVLRSLPKEELFKLPIEILEIPKTKLKFTNRYLIAIPSIGQLVSFLRSKDSRHRSYSISPDTLEWFKTRFKEIDVDTSDVSETW
jgi:superfamily II DNA or RNA helicase